jgi:hypothetical protein
VPPRHAYWTIIVDNLPTAFRSGRREELLPTFERLRRKHPNAVLRWFARGRLWDSPEAAQQQPPRAPAKTRESRQRDWRPGGEHRDPRDRFRKEQQARWRALRERTHARREATGGKRETPQPGPRPQSDAQRRRPASAPRRPRDPRESHPDRPLPRKDEPAIPPLPPARPPGPDRPPRPGQEPAPVPKPAEEIVIPRDPPERGAARRPKAPQRPPRSRR